MSNLLSKAKGKLPGRGKESGTASSASSSGSSPTRKSKGSGSERVIPPESVQQQVNGDFSQNNVERPLQLHNLARANRRCKSLQWDARLAEEAEAYAETLAEKGVLEHSGIGTDGENIFMSVDDASFDQAVDSWLEEEKKYSGQSIGEGNIADWGHFSK